MKVAYFSPMPPERSGIADYSALLLPELAQRVDVQIVRRGRKRAPRGVDVSSLPRRQQPRRARLDRGRPAPAAGGGRPSRLRAPPSRCRDDDRAARRSRVPGRHGARGRRRRTPARPCRPRQADPAAVGAAARGLPSRRRGARARDRCRRPLRVRPRPCPGRGLPGTGLGRSPPGVDATGHGPGGGRRRPALRRLRQRQRDEARPAVAGGVRPCAPVAPGRASAPRRRDLAGFRSRPAPAATRARCGRLDPGGLRGRDTPVVAHGRLRRRRVAAFADDGRDVGNGDPRAHARQAADRVGRRLVRRAVRRASP